MSTVLFVCTGNICRSPMAEGLLRARFDGRGLETEVRSAGLVFEDRPATDEAIAAVATMGVDIRGHRSRVITREIVHEAELVLGMERLHVREAMALDRDAASRCFTLKELARRGAEAGARAPGETMQHWLDRVGAGRPTLQLMGSSADDDIADPYRQSPAVYRRCLAEIAGVLEQVVPLVWPDASEGVA